MHSRTVNDQIPGASLTTNIANAIKSGAVDLKPLASSIWTHTASSKGKAIQLLFPLNGCYACVEDNGYGQWRQVWHRHFGSSYLEALTTIYNGISEREDQDQDDRKHCTPDDKYSVTGGIEEGASVVHRGGKRVVTTAVAAGAAGARIVAQPAVSVVSFFKDRADGKSKMFCGKRSSGKKKGEEVCDGDRCSEGGDEGCVTDEENPQAKGTKKMKCVSIGFPHVNGRCRFQTGKGSGHGTLMTNAFCEDDEECGPNEKCAARTKTCSPK